MEDLDKVVQEIDNLPDDLYLDDVGGERPGKKFANWIALRNRRNMGSRGRGRTVKRAEFECNIDNTEDDLFGPDEHDLNALENWDLGEDELDDLVMEGERSKKEAFRSRSLRGRGVVIKRGQFKRGASQRQFRPERYEGVKSSEDIFDIEGKSHRQRFVWNREDVYSNDERVKRTGENVERDEHMSPGFLVHRKDPRTASRQLSESSETRFAPSRNDPRLKQPDAPSSEVMDNIYAPARKDPRLVPQQALTPRQQSNRPRSDPRLKQFEARFGIRKDPRFGADKVATLQNQTLDIAPPGVEEIVESAPSNEQTKIRRGPRSPSPSPPPRLSGELSISISPGRKHERSPSSWRSRSHRERSPSPRRRSSRRDSLSPRRRVWRSSSRDRGSPSRHARRERSLSPRSRRRHSREFSMSPRREHSHDRSLSDRRDRSLSPRGRHSPFSPPHRSSLSSSRDESWRQSPGRMPPPPRFAQMQPPQQQSFEVLGPPPPPNMYSEGNYSGSAPSAPSYGGPPASASAQPPPPGYSNYQQYGYDNYYQQPPPPPAPNSYSGEYGPPGMPPATWSDGGLVYPDISQPPPLQVPGASGNQAPGTGTLGGVDQKSEEAKKEAVKNELIQQKQTLAKQREEYVRKKTLIAHELELLREQEEELLEEDSRDNDRILKENHKLQLEIQNKLKAINNVIDMLTGIIGDKDQLDEKRKASHKESEKKKPKTPPETPPQSSSDSERDGKANEENSKLASKERPAYNYVHYDPEMHWCRVCDVFPRTAKEYLNHLHSTEHKEETLERKLVDMPWHKNMPDQEVPHIPGAPTKRTPIRGLQFFISATAWYCKMCDVWIGDLHCASLHLKSKRHAENYAKFTEQNPHWETDWLADRERAYERCSEERRRVKDEKDALPSGMEQASSSGKQFVGYPKNIKTEVKDEKLDLKTKKKNKEQRKKMKKNCLTALDEVKKKKRHKKKQKSKKSHGSPHSSYSSSSSSDSDSSSSSSDEGGNLENEDKSKSIRVAMRNKIKGFQEHVQQHQVPLLPRSRWDSPPEEKPDEAEKERTEWMREEHISNLKQPSGDDKLIREWMSSSKEVSDGEKQLLNSIKDRLRQKQEADRERERERRDDRRDSRRSKIRSDSPSSPSYRSKRSRTDKSPEERRDRSSRFDRYDRHEPIHRSPERSSRRDSSLKNDQKSKEESEVKLPDRKSELEKKILAKFDEEEDDDEESAESKFEKQTAESAAKLMKKAKKPAVMAIPKSKLPFIGRMPILKHFAKKKKPDETKSENENKKQPPEDPLVQAQYKLEFTNVGGKVHIGPQESGTIGPELPPAEQVQDMEIDEDTSNSDVSPPVIETSVTVEPEAAGQSPSPKKPLTDIPLPKDFQDALNILFPGQEGTEKKEESGGNPSGVIQSGPKPPSNHQQGHWPPGHPQMGGPPMMPPMQGYGASPQGPQMMGGGGPPMMGPMHGLHGPHPPSHMQGPQGMYGPPFGMPVPPGTMMNPQNVPHPANMMRKSEPPLRHPPPPPPKESKPPIKAVTPKKEMPVKKSDVVGGMSADELAMLGIDVGDMAAQSF